MSRLLSPSRPGAAAWAALLLAALGVAVAGYDHARLFHRGYAEAGIVGPLFWLNGIATAVVLLFLVFGRVRLFVLGTLLICVPSIVSILLSHSAVGFFGFREGIYDADGTIILAAEVVATLLVLAALAFGATRATRHEVAA